MAMENHSRRAALALGAKSIAAASLTSKLFGASVGDRVAVCVHLNGGADSNNMIVPLDDAGYAAYAAARGPLAIPRNTLLPITSIRLGRSFGLNPALADLQSLFKEKTLAPVLNVGVLSQLMTKTELRQRLGVAAQDFYECLPQWLLECRAANQSIGGAVVGVQQVDLQALFRKRDFVLRNQFGVRLLHEENAGVR